ncbi:MAG: RluA family pseudouridine synthase [Bacteroidales bacterium]|nr:RluA family pseudouridine synthase [Bacteroidales bacterium]
MFYRNLSSEEYASLEARILYEDNHLLIVNKLPGEITQGDKTGDECIADAYKAFIAKRDSKPGQVFLGIPHRLDRPVSGICVLAKTSKALGRLGVIFRDGGAHKTYWALCCEKPEPAEGHLENWLIKNEPKNKSYICGEKPGAKLAKLNYRWLQSTDNYHLVEVELLTGRHHQIRCQLGHIGCPIKGDLKYGAPRSNPDGSICLHARHIRLEHPVKHTEILVSAPPPASWPL